MHFRILPNEHNDHCKTLLTTVKAVKQKQYFFEWLLLGFLTKQVV